MKKLMGMSMAILMGVVLGGCGSSGYNSYYVAPQPKEKSLDQVAKDSVSHLSAEETAQLNKLSAKK